MAERPYKTDPVNYTKKKLAGLFQSSRYTIITQLMNSTLWGRALPVSKNCDHADETFRTILPVWKSTCRTRLIKKKTLSHRFFPENSYHNLLSFTVLVILIMTRRLLFNLYKAVRVITDCGIFEGVCSTNVLEDVIVMFEVRWSDKMDGPHLRWANVLLFMHIYCVLWSLCRFGSYWNIHINTEKECLYTQFFCLVTRDYLFRLDFRLLDRIFGWNSLKAPKKNVQSLYHLSRLSLYIFDGIGWCFLTVSHFKKKPPYPDNSWRNSSIITSTNCHVSHWQFYIGYLPADDSVNKFVVERKRQIATRTGCGTSFHQVQVTASRRQSYFKSWR